MAEWLSRLSTKQLDLVLAGSNPASVDYFKLIYFKLIYNINIMSYEKKYLKYKEKYLALKKQFEKQFGGTIIENIDRINHKIQEVSSTMDNYIAEYRRIKQLLESRVYNEEYFRMAKIIQEDYESKGIYSFDTDENIKNKKIENDMLELFRSFPHGELLDTLKNFPCKRLPMNQNFINNIDDIVATYIIDDCKSVEYTKKYYSGKIKKHPEHNICYHHSKKYNIGMIKTYLNENRFIPSFDSILNFIEFPEFLPSKTIPNYYFDRDLSDDYNLKDLINQLMQVENYVVTDDIIPCGRLNYESNEQYIGMMINLHLLRDKNYYINFNNILDRLGDLNNILFIDFTGHCSSFVINLLERGIDVKLQIPSRAIIGMPILLNQFQDMIMEVTNKEITNNTSLGIYLMEPHGIGMTFDLSRFPSKQQIIECGFRKIVITTEGLYNIEPLTSSSITYRGRVNETFPVMKEKPYAKEFYNYIDSLGIETIFYGINESETRGLSDSHTFVCE